MSRQLYEIKKSSIDEYIDELPKYTNITFIGIQGKPGLKFNINNSGIITIGNTGMLQLDVGNSLNPIVNFNVENNQNLGEFDLIIHLIAVKRGDN